MNYILIVLFTVAVSSTFGGVLKDKLHKNVQPVLSSDQNQKLRKTSDGYCNINEFSYCTDNYAHGLNLAALPSEAIQFYYYILGMVSKNGKDGFETMCKATNRYVECLGESFDSCITVNNLEALGFSSNSAPGYATCIQELKFECGPAYEIFYAHHQCVVEELRLKTFQLLICMETFNNSVRADPTKLCDSLQTFTECNMNVFAECGEDLTTALCETFNAGYSVSMPMCHINCAEKSNAVKSKQAARSNLITK